MKLISALLLMTTAACGAFASEFSDLQGLKVAAAEKSASQMKGIAVEPTPAPMPVKAVVPYSPQVVAELEERLTVAGFSPSQAKRLIQYSDDAALNLLDKSNEDGLTPISVCRGMRVEKANYDPRFVGIYGAIIGDFFYYKLYTSLNIKTCLAFAEQQLILKLKIPKLFLLEPCNDYYCVFDRGLAADDRAYILEMGTFVNEVPVWTDYDSAFDSDGKLKI